MEKTSKITSGIILTCCGILLSLSDIKNALLLLGIFIAISGVQLIIDTIEKNEP